MGMSDIERKVLEREETILEMEEKYHQEATLLSAGQALLAGCECATKLTQCIAF